MIKKPFGKKTWLLLVATIPAGVIGILFSDFVEGMFDISCVYVGFYFTAFILLFASGFAKTANKGEVSLKSSAVMGVMQSLALLPGVSRSGSTLLGGVFCGVKKTEAAKFSFLMSVPIIAASGILKVFEFSGEGVSSQLAFCSVFGGVSAFVFGMIGIKFFLKILEKAKLYYFSYYLFALGTILLFALA